MILLDSNIIIYSSKPEHSFLLDFLKKENIAVSIITKIEVLGYHSLLNSERIIFEKLFNTVEIIELNDRIANTAIEFRKKYKLTLGDAIIAASAVENNYKLITRNVKDFEKIKHLKVHNPF